VQNPNGAGQAEQCDDGNDSDTDACNNSCQLTTCGDGIVQNPNGAGQAEQCDDGDQNGQKGKCSTSCTIVGGGGGGGGGAPVVSSIGTCSVNGGGAYQCTGRKPYRNGAGWQDYVACKTANGGFDVTGIVGRTLEQKCVTAWARSLGLETCGNAGDSASNNASVCNPLPPVTAGTITPVTPTRTCSGCFKASLTLVDKNIVKTDGTLTKNVNVARGDKVKYNIKLTLGIDDHTHYQLTYVDKVRFYDFTVPADGGSLYDRSGLNAGWVSNASGRYFELTNFAEKDRIKNSLNHTGGATVSISYEMDSALASTADTASIKNVAFAVVNYGYKKVGCLPLDNSCDTFYTQSDFITGPNIDTQLAFNIWEQQRKEASFSSLGSSATVNIIRPFVQASNGGNLGFQNSQQNKITATNLSKFGVATEDFTTGSIFVDDTNSLFEFDGYTTIDQIDPLKEFQTDDIDKYYSNLKFNTLSVTELGQSFEKTPIQEVYFLENGNLSVNGSIELGGKNKTYIIENGDLIIGANGLELNNGFAGFIVRNGDIIIDKNATNIEGIFIAENGKVKSTAVSNIQLKVSGALMGDLSPILGDRRYIGDGSTLEPSVKVEFDLRLLENTPPTLEKFLGSNWKESIQ